MDGIAWASSAMVAARTRLDIATENLANVSSDGFRRCLARGRISAHGVEITRVVSPDHGSLRHTGRPFDLAIVGTACFVYATRTELSPRRVTAHSRATATGCCVTTPGARSSARTAWCALLTEPRSTSTVSSCATERQ